MKISTQVTVELPDEVISITEIEEQIALAVAGAGRELVVAALGEVEAGLLASQDVAKQTRKSRVILTRFGRCEISRYKVRAAGRMCYLLDESVGLVKRAEPTPFLRELAATLTTKGNLTYRESADIITTIVGEPVNYRSLWGWIQADGKRASEAARRATEAIFEDGLLPSSGTPREIVVIQADGTFIRDCKAARAKMEAKAAIIYTGRQLVSASAKHKRYRLTEKITLATTRGVEELAKWVVEQGERHFGLSKASNVLVIGDGADWCQDFLSGWFPDAVYQLDHYHLREKLRRLAHGDEKLFAHLTKLVLSKHVADALWLIKAGITMGKFDSEEADDVISYLESNEDAIWGSRSLVGKAPKEVLVVGSGAIEKTQDVFIGRRMKRRGMRWSRTGAENLLALRCLAAQPKQWKAFWQAA